MGETGQVGSSEVVARPRVVFAERFALLYAEAGNPPLKRVTESVTRARQVDERGLPLSVPAQRISDWRRGRNVPARFAGLSVVLGVLIGEARKRRATQVTPGLYDIDAWRALWEAALASPIEGSEEAPADTAPVGDDSGVCPYRGLASFRQEDSAWFFGRERSTRSLITRLRQASEDGGFVVLVGASGAGKSSLVRAGLGIALPAATLAGDQAVDWPILTMTPGVEPLKELGLQVCELGALLREAANTAAGGADPFAGHAFPDRIRDAVAQRTGGPDAGLVLVVDQFEETFTLCPDEDTRLLFIRALHAICTPFSDGRSAPGLVVLGVRADFYDRCLAYPPVVEAMQDRQMALGAMSVSELREAVGRPAKAVGLHLESGLVELMLADLGATVHRVRGNVAPAGYEAGALPLLSHALLATWQRRQAGRLTISGYRSAGGIHGAVAATAERAWSDLDDAGKAAARRMLLHLVRVGDTTRDVRKRSTRSELIEHLSSDTVAAGKALEVLTNARLVTLDAGSVEITHEALLEAWPRLRGWIDDNRAENLARQRLEADAATWDEQRRDTSLLYRGARLETTEHWAKGPESTETTPVARAFLAESMRHRRRTRWISRGAAAAVCVLAVIAVVAAATAIQQRDEAQFRQVVSESERLWENDPSLSAQIGLVAAGLRPEDGAVAGRLLETQHTPLATPLAGHTGAVYLTSFSPDGRTLATASYDQTVRLWDVSRRSAPKPLGTLKGHTSWVTSSVFSPDGRTLATAGNDKTVRLWDVSDRAHTEPLGEPLEGGNGTVYLVAFNAGGDTLATANEDQTARLWNVADPADPKPRGKPLRGHDGPVRSVAFSPKGERLATTGDDGTVLLWNVGDPDRPKRVGEPLAGHHSGVHSVAFSRDGRVIATGGDDKGVRLWDATDGSPLGQPLTGHTAPVWSVAFSPEADIVASASEDGTVRLWNFSDPKNVVPLGAPLESRANGVFALGFSPDGHTLAAGSGDSLVRLWAIPHTLLIGHGSDVTTSAFRPDGRLLATGSADKTVRLWDVSDPARPEPVGKPLTGHQNYVRYLTFSSDGRLLATASGDSTVRLWDVADPGRAVMIGSPLELGTRYASPLAMSPDGKWLATGDDDQSVQLWDISDPKHPERAGKPLAGHTGYVNHAEFSPDGHTLVTASSDQTVRLWDVSEPGKAKRLGRPLAGHTSDVNIARFSPDGATLVTAGADKTILLWDVRDPARPATVGDPLIGHSEGITSLSVGSDGRTLATGSDDGTIRLWDLTDPTDVPAGQALRGVKDIEHSVALSPRTGLLASASSDHLGRLWNLDVAASAGRICATTNGVLTQATWRQYLSQLAYEPPCG